MKLVAQAKINLSLRILGKRSDGYHEIETLMCPISIADTLEITRSPHAGIEFSCDDLSVPAGEENLVVRAANLFLQRTKMCAGLKIVLQKGIPHGAGLGGGSSDAAATLRGLNELLQTRLSDEQLIELAAGIGSDVAFFLFGSAAICRGRGEKVEAVPWANQLKLLFVKPPFGVPTPWAYQQWENSLELPEVKYAPQRFEWGELVNDLERPVFEKYIFLAHLKRWLIEQEEIDGALMSGSGSTMFAVLRSGAASLIERISSEFGSELWVREAQTLTAGAFQH